MSNDTNYVLPQNSSWLRCSSTPTPHEAKQTKADPPNADYKNLKRTIFAQFNEIFKKELAESASLRETFNVGGETATTKTNSTSCSSALCMYLEGGKTPNEWRNCSNVLWSSLSTYIKCTTTYTTCT